MPGKQGPTASFWRAGEKKTVIQNKKPQAEFTFPDGQRWAEDSRQTDLVLGQARRTDQFLEGNVPERNGRMPKVHQKWLCKVDGWEREAKQRGRPEGGTVHNLIKWEKDQMRTGNTKGIDNEQ